MWFIKSSVLVFLVLVIIACSPSQATAHYLCLLSCSEDDELSLQEPYMISPDVSALQFELMLLGYYKGALDGVYGPKTAQAFADFQRDEDLPVSGITTNQTWQKLANHLDTPVVKESISPPEGDITIVIDIVNRTLTVMNDGEPYHQFRIAAGAPHTPSPVGVWHITRKAKNWGTGFGTRWIGLNVRWGMYGIHGTNKPGSIGSYASHGCIRMHNSKVEQLYPWVPVNAPVYIVGNPFGVPGHTHRTLAKGERGSDVAVVQDYLKRHGYYEQEVDGIFGYGMREAVMKYREDKGMIRDDRVDLEMYKSMKL